MEDSPINIAYPAAENLRLRIAMGACRFEARAGEGEAWVAGVCHDPTERKEAARARVQLAQGDLAAAIRWAEESGLHADGAPRYPREEEYLTLVRVLIAQGSDDAMGSYLDDALDLIDRLFRAAEGGGRMVSVIEILALRALALQARHESGEALAALERALVFAQPEGYVRLFVDEGAPMEALLWEHLKARRRGARDAQQHPLFRYVRQVLAAFESPHADTTAPPPPPGVYAPGQDQPLPEHLTLTAREREVLELITEGLSNQEIASRLFIATSTVKGYVHSILRKLEVDSRTKAISRAHELHLISE